jgi:adenosylcobinamide-GDP ribazoletransferase
MTALLRAFDLGVAFSLLSRLPVDRLMRIPDIAWQRQAQAVWAFPLVGAVLGGLAALAGYCALALSLPPLIAAGISLAVLAISSGAMHEDGLADCADGFWGGSTRERRLEIMKDSQIGTYGVLALIFVTGLRWVCYGALFANGTAAVIAVAALSRAAMPSLMCALPHARATGLSYSVGRAKWPAAGVSALLGIVIAVLCLGSIAVIASLAVAGTVIGVALLAKAKIGGQTGDVLGAAQQMAELSALLTLLALA